MALPEKSIGVSYSWLVDKAAEVQRRQDQGPTSPRSEAGKPSPVEATASATENKETSSTPTKPRGNLSGFKPRLVQDAHTIWEQTLYETMWAKGGGPDDGPRVIQAGYRRLAEACFMGDKAI